MDRKRFSATRFSCKRCHRACSRGYLLSCPSDRPLYATFSRILGPWRPPLLCAGCCEHTADDAEGCSGLSAQQCTRAILYCGHDVVVDIDSRPLVRCSSGGSVGSTSDSIAWAGSSVPWSIHICETSRTVSVVAQKKAGLSFQPTWYHNHELLSWFGGHDVCKNSSALPSSQSFASIRRRDPTSRSGCVFRRDCCYEVQ
jgi:hypothetical protein